MKPLEEAKTGKPVEPTCRRCFERLAHHTCEWCGVYLCDGCNFGTQEHPRCESCRIVELDEYYAKGE